MDIDYRNVKLNGGFWKAMEDLNKEVVIDAVWNRFEETGRIDAFNFNWKEGDDEERKPHLYWDSDVAKWMEGACNILCRGDRPDLREKVDRLVDLIEKHQREDGYFNIYLTVCEPEKRFTDRNCHELYCAGHLMEAAVAYFYATGSRRMIEIMQRYADYIEQVFVKEQSAAFVTPGHQEIELALVKFYRVTGEERYLKLSEFFLKNRGANEKDKPIAGSLHHAQDNVRLEELDSAVGHAVRCLYMLCGMIDCAVLTNNQRMIDACVRTYNDIVTSKMYITGGVGSTHFSEAFTIPYDLPNQTAYAETCAAIALMLFSNRMGKHFKEAKYADTVERAMYNGMCSGVSLDGQSFFYENPLEIDVDKRKKQAVKLGDEHMPLTERQKVFHCSCCPPNLNRILSSMGDFIYDMEEERCYINQFTDSCLTVGDITVTQKTDYPWNGWVEITASGAAELYIRIPAWCESFNINREYTMKNGYAVVKNDGAKIVLEMAMEPFLVMCDPRVAENVNKTAVQCGPVVYCVESVDNCENLHSLFLTTTKGAQVQYDNGVRGNAILLDGMKAVQPDGLYTKQKEEYEKVKVKLIPYYAFANRGESNMLVWLNHKGGTA